MQRIELDTAFADLQQSLRNYLRRRLPDPSVADELVRSFRRHGQTRCGVEREQSGPFNTW